MSEPATRLHQDRVPWTPALFRLMAGLLLSLFVAAMDSTVVGTALPTIAKDLGSFSLYPWIFTGYLLTSTTTVPLWGRLADMAGRRTVLMTGLAVFVLSSVLCGLARNMPALILFRSLQGIGAGCIQPVTFTVVGDVFPIAQRARLQGFFSAMWAIAAIVGPALGAAFVSTIGWRWIFGINLPIGIVACTLLWGYRERRPQSARQPIDIAGALTLTAGVALLLWGLGAGSAGAHPIWPAAAAGAILLGLFALVERRAPAPTVPLDLLRHRVTGPAIAASLLAGTLMFAVTAYVPLYVQAGLGGTAYAAGAALAPMSLGWPVGSVVAGRILLRAGFPRLVAAGAGAMVAGSTVLALLGHTPLLVGAACAVIGLGMGLLSTPILILLQTAVGWERRGAATALNQFSRTIGGAVGVSLLGVLIEAKVGAGGAAALGGTARPALATAIGSVFWVDVGIAVAALALALIILASRPPALGGTAPGRA